MTRALWGIALLAVVSATASHAQNTRLRLDGFSGDFGNNTVAHFDQGYADSPSGIRYRVDVMTQNTQRVTSVYIRANSATLGGSKPVGDMQWRRDDLSSWNPLTTGNVLVESRTIQTNGTLWQNFIWFRCLLDWANDAPAAYSVGITVTLVVTAP
jgi:hypothetical protein